MKFKRTTPDENFFIRFVSEGGRWEVGLTRMLFGVRIRLGLCGEGWCVLDYCAGASVTHQVLILAAVQQLLSIVPEDAPTFLVGAIFPTYTVKPIWKDPTCYDELIRRAEEVGKLGGPLGEIVIEVMKQEADHE